MTNTKLIQISKKIRNQNCRDLQNGLMILEGFQSFLKHFDSVHLSKYFLTQGVLFWVFISNAFIYFD